MVYDVLDIANKLLFRAELESGGELMSNMKLQKMLYYQQGYHLAVFDAPLFDDNFEAWTYGPVVPRVYNHFKNNGAGGIAPENRTPLELSEEEEQLFNDVCDAYINFSAIGLMGKTHNEEPWKSTYEPGKNKVIPVELMKKFFKTQME